MNDTFLPRLTVADKEVVIPESFRDDVRAEEERLELLEPVPGLGPGYVDDHPGQEDSLPASFVKSPFLLCKCSFLSITSIVLDLMMTLEHLFEGDFGVVVTRVEDVHRKCGSGAVDHLVGRHELPLVQSGVQAENHGRDQLGPLVAIPFDELPDVGDDLPVRSLHFGVRGGMVGGAPHVPVDAQLLVQVPHDL